MFQNKLFANSKIAFLASALFCCLPLERIQAGDALIWEAGDGYRRARLKVSATGKTGFTLLDPNVTGIHWTNKLSIERVLERQNLMNAPGVAAVDVGVAGRGASYFSSKEGAKPLYRN